MAAAVGNQYAVELKNEAVRRWKLKHDEEVLSDNEILTLWMKEQKEKKVFEDGMYSFIDIKKHFNIADDFKSEKELCNYLELNIRQFCSDIGVNYKSHERESYITRFKRFGNNKPKIDFLIQDQDGEYILVEVKRPRFQREAVMAISQLLEYIVIAEREGLKIKSSYLLTTKCENDVIEVIARFALPIDVILFAKGKMAIWDKEVSIYDRSNQGKECRR